MSKWLVFFLLVAALGVRLYRLTDPPLDFHQTRQYIGAIVARAYYFEHKASIPEWRREIARTTKNDQGLLEPQILPALAVAGYWLAGGEQLWIPRLISVLGWLLGGVFLRRIAAETVSPRAALIALAFYLFMPFAIMASRSFQPDPMMVMMMLVSLHLLLRYDSEPTTSRFGAVALAVMVAMLVRPLCVFELFAAFGALMIARRGLLRGVLCWHSVGFAVIALTPTVAFYVYGILTGGFIRDQSSISFVSKLFGQAAYWQGWLGMIGRVVGILPAFAALVSALFFARGRLRILLLALWAGYFAYGLAFNYHIHTHDYYSLPLIPIVALSLAPGAEWVMVWFAAAWAERRTVVIGLAIVTLATGAGAAWEVKRMAARKDSATLKSYLQSAGQLVGLHKKFAAFLRPDRAAIKTEVADYQQIGEVIGHSARAIYLAEDYGKALIYHGEFSGVGWPTSNLIRDMHRTDRRPLESVADFEELARKRQAEFFVVTAVKDFDSQAELKEHVTGIYPVLARTDRFIVFRLKGL